MNDIMKIISLPPICQIAAHHTSAGWVPCLVQASSAPQSPVERRGSARLHFPTDACASQESEQRNLTALFQRQTDRWQSRTWGASSPLCQLKVLPQCMGGTQ